MRVPGWLPSAFTFANLVCGFSAICLSSHAGGFERAAALIFLAIVLDGLDGALARKTGKSSAFGGELDSLADLVSFGIAPGFFLYMMSDPRLFIVLPGVQGLSLDAQKIVSSGIVLAVGSFYVICAAARLARFNVEHDNPSRPKGEFEGLPSPAAAGMVASLVLLQSHTVVEGTFFRANAEILPLAGILSSWLMVSRVPYPHFLRLVGSSGRTGRAVVCIVLLIFLMALNVYITAWSFTFLPVIFPAIFWTYAVYGIVRAIVARGAPAPGAVPPGGGTA
ncbi:MAG: CDP-diacylglycerol--serine O-phosphatidyltransferase [Planctomycetota bacterium]